MNLRFNWTRIAQCVVALAGALALKLHYSTASADQLRWILAPTAALVELVSGASFEFESRAGYISRERGFLIANSCAGVNFLIAAFLTPMSPVQHWITRYGRLSRLSTSSL